MNLPDIIVLRDLPGIREIEAGLQLRNAEWAQENEKLQERCDELSKVLFGITIEDTRPFDQHFEPKAGFTRETADRFDQNFEVLSWFGFPEATLVWEALRIDIYDDEGAELRCLSEFGRQLIAVRKGLMGHLPALDAARRVHEVRSAKSFQEDLETAAREYARRKRL